MPLIAVRALAGRHRLKDAVTMKDTHSRPAAGHRPGHGGHSRRFAAGTPAVVPRAAFHQHPAPPPAGGASHAGVPSFETFDRMLRAVQARLTQGISPTAVAAAWMDWAVHLGCAPGKQLALSALAAHMTGRYAMWLARSTMPDGAEPVVTPAEDDRRFADPAWARFPFNALVQSFLLAETWWQDTVCEVPGMTRQHGEEVAFMLRQPNDMLAPSNIPWLNPVVMTRSMQESGFNFLRGVRNWLEDMDRLIAGRPPKATGMTSAPPAPPQRPTCRQPPARGEAREGAGHDREK